MILLYTKLDQASNFWQQLKLASDLQGTVDYSRKWLFDFNAGKTELVLFDQSNIPGAIMLKWLGLFFNKSHLSRSRSCLSVLNLIGAFVLPQLSPRKLEPSFVL